jgi:peptidoglycan hydrolase-like protein with peptidoglycan-binding domain
MSRKLLRSMAATLVAVAAGVTAALLPGAPASAAPPGWPMVSSGQSGITVSSVQLFLRQRGSGVGADGVYGPQTVSAVQAFQSANGLSADGVVGPLTWSKLVVPVAEGGSGEAVRALQGQLNRHGYGLAVDGAFGPTTASAVTSFKSARSAGSGSTVDVTTWQWLIGYGPSYVLPLARTALPRSEYDDPHHDYPAIDLPVGTGTQAYAAAAGSAARVDDSSCGRGVVITNAAGVRFVYCHFSNWAVASGASVAPGQLVGYTGSTGNSTGPHLHFGVKTGTTSRCPQSFLLALYDGVTPPNPATLPTTGCFYAGRTPYREDPNL